MTERNLVPQHWVHKAVVDKVVVEEAESCPEGLGFVAVHSSLQACWRQTSLKLR